MLFYIINMCQGDMYPRCDAVVTVALMQQYDGNVDVFTNS
jgi:hypothetical protein